MSKVMERLERMESLISGIGKAPGQTHCHEDVLEEDDWDFPSHNEGPAIDQFVPGPTPESRSSHRELPDSLARPLSLSERRPSSYLSPETHRISLPNLEKWSCLLPLNQIEYNEGELYFQTEIRQGARLYGYTPSKAPDTSPRICLKLQRLFATNVLPWIPLFDPEYCHQLVASASSNRFQNRNVSLALVMFIFALGAISNDDLNTGDSPEDFAGIEYFVQGYQIIDSNRAECNTITVVQCRILWA
jgi:hypothetical protein